MKGIEIHKKARLIIRGFSKQVRAELGSALIKAQLGMSLDLPLSRPMSEVLPGAYELRFTDRSGIQRVLYYSKAPRAFLVFHAFTKKTQKTPQSEIILGRKRLLEMLSYEKR